jgi:hypothetical protein
MSTSRTPEQVEAEARRLVAVAAAEGVELRLLGGLAVRVHCPAHAMGKERDYSDVDFVTADGLSKVERAFEAADYQPFARFNALHGHSRAIFYGPGDRLKVDIFLGGFSMCHTLPLGERLDADEPTVPLAELLLTKLQIVRLTAKDLFDLGVLLAEHPVGDGDVETIDGERVALLCSRDWGLQHTVERGLDRLDAEVAGLLPADAPVIRERVAELRRRLEAHPKTRKWRLRARLGERVPWHEEPDEVVDEQ